jgi:nitrogen fixation/metabolism regulation signal transduction histidine kinase
MSFRNARLSTRLGLMLAAILGLAAVAQTLLYLKTRDETVKEADDSYQSLAKAIEVATTQIGPEGWKDERVLADYRRKLAAKGLRDIQVTEAGRPFPPEPVPTPRGPLFPKKTARPKASSPHDILISGTVGEGTPNRTLLIPLVLEGKLVAYVKISYSLENIREQLADNFRRRLYALLGVFALGLAVTLVVTRNATTPLEALDEAAERVAAGQLDVSVPVRRDDEIGRLSATFNRMTDSLRERKELEQRLLAAERRAEIGHLASGLAHEIKNPLNALSLGLDVLRRRHRPSDPVAASEHAARIEALREEINRLTILINNFLAFGRPLTMAPQTTDMASLVNGTLSDLSELAERAHVTVQKEVAESLPPVRVDPSLLKSAVWNLVQNAVQSMEATGGTMRVSLALENGSAAGNQLVFQVEDSGPGLDPADLPRLFEPYFSRKEGGVGLGLAMVKRIVEDHGGRVAAENREEPGTGSRFRIILPV